MTAPDTKPESASGANPTHLFHRRLADPPPSGRIFSGSRRVRLSDTSPGGRLRLDAIARYLQDIAIDDVVDADAEEPGHVWLVRRAIVDVLAPPLRDASVTLDTWADGVGRSWATRRTRLLGDAGGHAEAESLWVFLNSSSMRPITLPSRFHQVYGASLNKRVSSKLLLRASPPPGAQLIDWPLRITDFDIMGHMNNAAYWEPVESIIASQNMPAGPSRTVMEFRQGIDIGNHITLAHSQDSSGFTLWFLSRDATAAVAEYRANQ